LRNSRGSSHERVVATSSFQVPPPAATTNKLNGYFTRESQSFDNRLLGQLHGPGSLHGRVERSGSSNMREITPLRHKSKSGDRSTLSPDQLYPPAPH
jgi:hypothetical protein